MTYTVSSGTLNPTQLNDNAKFSNYRHQEHAAMLLVLCLVCEAK